MAHIIPFKGLKYNKGSVNIGDVVSLPYDKLDAKNIGSFEGKSPYNIARLIKGDYLRKDSGDEWYGQVKKTADEWISANILVTSPAPSLYIYEQTFTFNGKKMTRISFSALGELTPFTGGSVKPHENTFSGPKKDRYKLLQATHMNFGHIFMLYYGEKNDIRESLAKKISELQPEFDCTDDFGVHHRLFEVKEPFFIDKITSAMEKQKLLIADGHHRYETALEFYEQMKKENPAEAERFKYRLMTFVDINDPALAIYPTHRVLNLEKDITPDGWKDILNKLSSSFDVSEPMKGAGKARIEKELCSFEKDVPAYVMAHQKEIRTLKAKKDALSAIKEVGKKLDVAVLQDTIIRGIFGKDIKSLSIEKDIFYFKNTEDVLDKVRSSARLLGFIVRPTPIEHVKAVVEENGRMPQKSTDFYPKIYSGFVMHKM